MSHSNSFRALGGDIHWGHHDGGRRPRNYLEVRELLFDAEEFVRTLVKCGPSAFFNAALTHYRCGCLVRINNEGPPDGSVHNVFSWNPRADRWVFDLYTLRFDQELFLELLRWIERQEAWWNPRSRRPLDLTDEDRRWFERLKALAEKMAGSSVQPTRV